MSKKHKVLNDDFDIFNFDSPADDESDDISDIENFEKAANEEVAEHMLAIREATANTKKSLENQWNTDFYFCAYFADNDQRDEFLRKADALGLVKDNFIDGSLLAEKLGIDLTPKEIEVPKLFNAKKDWFDITMDFEL